MHLNQGRVAKTVFTLSTLTASCLMAFNSYAAVDCSTLETWDSATVYTGGDQVSHDGSAYSANYWNQNNNPSQFEGDYAQWKKLDVCSGDGGGGTPNEAPTASLTAPTASDVIVEGDNVVLSATALDADGSVASVEFSVDGASVAVVTSAPFEAAWSATSGNHQVSVVATDNEGAASVASAVSVSVDSAQPGNEAPTVSVALSAASVDVGGVVTLTATAADSDGTVDKVDFYVAGALIGTAATNPYTLDYTTTQA
ncbi:Ig-like domain-containing protein, partial [Vibrio cyclitrophicus]